MDAAFALNGNPRKYRGWQERKAKEAKISKGEKRSQLYRNQMAISDKYTLGVTRRRRIADASVGREEEKENDEST